MALDYSKPLPPGSHAWCSDCPWTDETEWAHRESKAHCDDNQHLVHLYEKD